MSNDERIAILETTIHHIDASLTGITQELRRLSERMDSGFDGIHRRFEEVDKKFERIDSKFEGKFDRVDQRFLEIDKKIDSQFRWTLGMFRLTLGIMLGGFTSTLGILAHALHWF